jgi:hypothetical protein
MDVGAVGAGSPNPLDPVVRPSATPSTPSASASLTASPSEDQIAVLLQSLASPQIGELLGLMEGPRLTQDPVLLEGLLRTAIAAVDAHDLAGALAAITTLVTLNPERGAQLVSQETSLIPIRVEVKDLLQRLALSAKAEAEHTLAAASLAIETGTAREPRPAIDPTEVLAIAQRLLETGQHINFVRAAELAQTACSYYILPAPVPEVRLAQRPSAGNPFRDLPRSRQAFRQMKAMWRRAPVLLLLLGWFSVGLIGGFISLIGRAAGWGPLNSTVIAIWAVAFLVLIVFQFFATTMKARP